MARFEVKDIKQEEKDHWKKISKSHDLTMKGLFKLITTNLSLIAKNVTKIKK